MCLAAHVDEPVAGEVETLQPPRRLDPTAVVTLPGRTPRAHACGDSDREQSPGGSEQVHELERWHAEALDSTHAARPRRRRIRVPVQAVRGRRRQAGEAHYAVLIEPGETIWTGDGRKLSVVDVVPVEEEDSPFVGFLARIVQ